MNQTEIASAIIANLAVVEPDLDTSIGCTVRKMIDAFSEQIAEAYLDNNISSYQYDINSLSGTALDDFTANFGFSRFGARYASGVVSFYQAQNQTGSAASITIPAGTTVATNDAVSVAFTTVLGVTMASSQASMDISVQAVVAGSSGNVTAASVTNILTPLSSISGVTNATRMFGGSDAESDSAYRTRFKTTVFKGFLGTTASFSGTVLENSLVSRAVTIGSSVQWNEQIQFIGGLATSSVQDAGYIFPYNQFLQNSNGAFLNPGVDFAISFTPSVPNPTVAPSLAAVGAPLINSGTTYGFRYYWLTSTGSTLLSPQSTIVGQGTTGIVIQWPTPPPGAIGIVIVGFTVGAGTPQVSFAFNHPASLPVWTNQPVVTATTSIAELTVGGANPIVAGRNYLFANTALTTNAIYTAQALPTANTTAPTTILTSLNPVTCPNGLYQFQFNYNPLESRNSISSNISTSITNRVDIYTDGVDVQESTQVLTFYNNGSTATSNAKAFNIDPLSPYYYLNFQHPDGTYAQPGNLLIPLTNTPVTSLPPTLYNAPTVGTPQGYNLGTNYWQISNVSETGGSNQSLDGIEWLVSTTFGANSSNNSGTLTVDYFFNALPLTLSNSITMWGLTNNDVMIHEAIPVYLNVYLVVVLSFGQTASSVNSALSVALDNYISSIPIGTSNSVVEVSSIEAVANSVAGIQAVRMATANDALAYTAPGNPNALPKTNYAIQQVSITGDLIQTFLYNNTSPTDVILDLVAYPVFNSVSLSVRSQNTFRGAGS